MYIRNSYFVLIGLLLVILLLVSCERQENKTSVPDRELAEIIEKTTKPQSGGTIIGGMDSTPTGMFNPLFYEDSYETNIIDFVFEGLVQQNDKLEYVPHLAKSWKINDDQTKITFQLNKDVTWHDGKKFTAHDVVFTYKVLADPDYITAGGIHSNYAMPLSSYEDYSQGKTDQFKGVVAEDDYTVTFTFSKPIINPLYTASFPIIPKHIFQDTPIKKIPTVPESFEAGKVIGTGPFKFAKMKERKQYVLHRFDDYWQGTPFLENIIWRVVESGKIISELQSGNMDFIAGSTRIPPADYNTVKGLKHITIIEQAGFGYQLLGFKLHHRSTEDVNSGFLEPDNWVPNEKLAELKIRQAIAYAINREQLIDNLLGGHGQIIHTPIPIQSWAYNNKLAGHPYDPKKAKKLLDDLGYQDTNKDRFREDPEQNEWFLTFDYPAGNEMREKTALLIKKMLEDVGINVRLRKHSDMAEFIEYLRDDNRDWDLFLLGLRLDPTDPDPSEFWTRRSPYNFSRWNSKQSDALLKKAIKGEKAMQQQDRKKVYADWQALFAEELPVLPLFVENHLWAYNKRLKGIEALPHSMYHNAHLWWTE